MNTLHSTQYLAENESETSCGNPKSLNAQNDTVGHRPLRVNISDRYVDIRPPIWPSEWFFE